MCGMTTDTQTRWLTEAEQRAWRGFQTMAMHVNAELSRRLASETGLSMTDYGVLMILSESEDDQLRSFELGRALDWEKSRLSHHLKRMEKRGLITRRQCPSDGRGLVICLTKAGRQTIEAAAPFHVTHARQVFVDLLTADELETLTSISAKILPALGCPEP